MASQGTVKVRVCEMTESRRREHAHNIYEIRIEICSINEKRALLLWITV